MDYPSPAEACKLIDQFFFNDQQVNGFLTVLFGAVAGCGIIVFDDFISLKMFVMDAVDAMDPCLHRHIPHSGLAPAYMGPPPIGHQSQFITTLCYPFFEIF